MWPFDPIPDLDADTDAGLAKAGPEPIPALLAAALGVLGRSLIVAGLLLLAFAGFQLWGTGIAEARAQEELAAEFEATLGGRSHKTLEVNLDANPTVLPLSILSEPSTPSTRSTPSTPSTPSEYSKYREAIETPDAGDPIGRIVIPAIDVEKTVVEGTTRDLLRSGPGHYLGTALPGQSGNVAIAGHRTTHGAPFFDIDKLVPGDEIRVETIDGIHTYIVEGQDSVEGQEGQLLGHRIVDPSDVSVIANKGDSRLTLTACHPKYSAEQRIIVTATLVSKTGTEVETETETQRQPIYTVNYRQPNDSQVDSSLVPQAPLQAGPTIDESLGWQRQYAPATFGWAAFTAAIAAAASLLGRVWRRAPTYAVAVPPFGLALYYCFVNLEHFIPAV